ncbi:MAG: hypothetical protein ABIQ59_03055 [Nocardioidaceae bacterium]
MTVSEYQCTEPQPETREACTGWFEWGDIRSLDVQDVSRDGAGGWRRSHFN